MPGEHGQVLEQHGLVERHEPLEVPTVLRVVRRNRRAPVHVVGRRPRAGRPVRDEEQEARVRRTRC